MSIISTAPSQEIHLETQAALYPTLQHLVCLLPLDHRRVTNYLQEEATRNPFLVYQGGSQSRQEVLINDVLPKWYTTPATEANLQEHLSGQISALSLPSGQRSALVYLTQWLSPAGYLEETPQ
ncbi:MAG: RNA polymerase subunit sigma-54, partial [Nostocaceae cyanobacterium]|nr:RNA polymerase subunit sigma-54 [Nostocaceae cyanobacterium]